MFYHFSNVIQIWFCWLGMWHNTCHRYWLDHWAEAWFLSLLSKIYPHLALKVTQIKYRKTSWDSGILIFPLVEMVQASTLSNKTGFAIHLIQCTWYFSLWTQRWYQTFTWNGILLFHNKPRLKHLSQYYTFTANFPRIKIVLQISEWLFVGAKMS